MIQTLLAVFLATILFPTTFGAPISKGNSDIILCLEYFRYENNKIYVVKSEMLKSDLFYRAVGIIKEIPRKRIWLEIYIAVGDRIHLHKIIPCKVTPAVPEKWDFEDFNIGDIK